jgi:glutamate synthase domain-containing protein 3
VIAAILGAEGFDFGKLLLVAEGCIMARICEKNTCPTGIATHDPKFKAKYKGNKEQVKKILRFVSEDVRAVLASIGVRSLSELVGRTDLLKVAAAHEAFVTERKLSLHFFLGERVVPGVGVGVQREGLGALNKQILDDARQAIVMRTPLTLSYEVTTADRGVLATLSGEISRRIYERRLRGEMSDDPPPSADITLTFTGSAGQGFGVFLVDGINVTLRGEANDSVCKSMSGGKVVIRPHPRATYPPEENAIIGHCALYGATGGSLFVQGLAGDRFGVRNSGATAVVEGAGLHACEYMTRGKVVILGPVSHNVGAGMTGGVVYMRRDKEQMVNRSYLLPRPLDETDAEELRGLIQAYHRETCSARAASLLEHWETVRNEFVRCDPRA